MTFNMLFKSTKPIIGMVHLLPLPGSPAYEGNIEAIYQQAEKEADIFANNGVDGIIVENFGDEPYHISEPEPQQLALLAAVTYQIRRMTSFPIGVNIQFNAWQAELAVATAALADFVRVEVFVDTVISAQGTIQPCSAQITRYRRALDSKVLLFADIQTKYTTSLIPQELTLSAIDAQTAGADALIVTGAATGKATPLEAVRDVQQVVDLPVLVGSGTTMINVAQVLAVADGIIVGSALKEDGKAASPVSAAVVKQFMQVVNKNRQ